MDTPLAAAGWALFDVVRLRRQLIAEGEDLPAGATGAIVELYPEDGACIVEFGEPLHAVVTVALSELDHDGP